MTLGLVLGCTVWGNDDRGAGTDRAAGQRGFPQAELSRGGAENPVPQPNGTKQETATALTNIVFGGNSVQTPQAEAAALKQQAVAMARQVVEAYPQDAVSYALLGSAHYNIGQSEEAARNLQRCLELDPRQTEAYEILARIAYEKGELETAVRLCEEALKRGPPNPGVLNRLGRSLLDLGRTEDAIQIARQAIKLPRPVSESYYLLGQAYLQRGEHARAKESFQQAITLLPDHTQAFFGLFTACLRLGQTEEAAQYREQFLKLEGIDRRSLTDRNAAEDTLTGLPLVRETVAKTLLGAGQIYRLHGQTDHAAGLFLRAALLDAHNPLPRSALEGLYLQRDALAEGVKAFAQLAASQPESSLNHLFLGRLHERLQQVEAAEQAYRKAQEVAPGRPEGYRALVELYLRSNRQPAEAKALARRLVELEPSGLSYYLLAFTCARTNDLAGAMEAIVQAVKLNPDNQRYQEFLQKLRAAR